MLISNLPKKINLLIPIAGSGQRFLDAGYKIPKQLIMCKDAHLIDYSMASIRFDECNLIFVVREDTCFDFNIDKVLIKKYKHLNPTIVRIREKTRGSVESCLAAKEYINNNLPLVIYCLDVNFEPIFVPSEHAGSNYLLTFKSNSPNYSYVEIGKKGIINTAEKKVISNDACVGVYGFRSGKIFIDKAEQMIKENLTTNGEFYITPLYNLIIRDGYTEDGVTVHIDKAPVKSIPVEKINIFGTPKELDFFKNNVLKRSIKKPVVLCSDHSGFNQKQIFIELLKYYNMKYIDVGCLTEDNCDYNDFIYQAVDLIKDGMCDIGFGFCRSGQGINIAANKFKGIKSALVYDKYSAEYAVRHNAANFFCIPEENVNKHYLELMLDAILYNTFDGGRHQVRVQKTEDIENDNR